MNISNIIVVMQEKMANETESINLMTYAKIIEKLKVGKVDVVSTFSDLPVLDNDGNIFFVESEDELYYNVGSTYIFLGKLQLDTLYSWGYNTQGQLGDNSITTKTSPVTVVNQGLGWSEVSAGGNSVTSFTLGIKTDGTLYAWGNNNAGQLGIGSAGALDRARSSPVIVVGGITNWSQVSAGGAHSLGVTDTGIVYGWGNNDFGQVGDNIRIPKSSPVTVVGGITNWSQVSAGDVHSLGLTAAGVVYAWGRNSFGQLGIGVSSFSSDNRSSPVTVVGGITNWSQVSAGGFHSLGLTDSGTLYGWGCNSTGQLGDNTNVTKSSPVTVVGGITNWSQVSAGFRNSLGLTDTGILYGWGNNASGQLGDNTNVTKSSPVTVVGGITNWSQVSAGSSNSFGLTDAGIIYGWGTGNRIGDNTNVTKSSPVTVVGGITNWSQVSAGGYFTLAIESKLKQFVQ